MVLQSDRANILYLSPGCFDKGGISRYGRYQIRALRDLTTGSVDVLSVLGPGEDAFEEPIDVRFAAGGVARRQKVAFASMALVTALRRRPTVVIAGHVNLSSLAHVVARMVGARSVLNVYGLEVWSGLRRDATWGLRGVDHVVSDCHFTARFIEGEGLRKAGSTDVVWDCVDLEKFSPGTPRPEVLARYNIPDPTRWKNVLSLGRISRSAAHKGYDRLLAAFASAAQKAGDLRLVFAGRGDLVEQLRADAHARGLEDRVVFTGMVHEDHLPDIYRAASVFSLVSDRGKGRGEGIPLTPLEASACGAPILVGNHDGSQEAIMDGNGFALDPFDLETHARRILDLTGDPALRASASRAAIEVTRREFSFERFRAKQKQLLARWAAGTTIDGA